MKHVLYLLLGANAVFFAWNVVSEPEDVVRTLPPLPETAQALVTLEEMRAAEAAKLESMTESQPPGAGAGMACQLLGPFVAIEDMQPLRERLDASGLEAREHMHEEQVQAGYRVYLPAMEREAALEFREILDEAGDSDYYIGKNNFISLGAFKERERAEVRLEQVKKLGLEALAEPLMASRTSYWLELDDGGESDPLAGILKEFPGVQVSPAACGSIAGAGAIP